MVSLWTGSIHPFPYLNQVFKCYPASRNWHSNYTKKYDQLHNSRSYSLGKLSILGGLCCLPAYVFVRLLCWDVFVYQKGTRKLVQAERSGGLFCTVEFYPLQVWGVFCQPWTFNIEILLLKTCLCFLQSVCHSGNLRCVSAQWASQREIAQPVGSSWATQAQRKHHLFHLLETVGASQQEDAGICCFGSQSNCQGKGALRWQYFTDSPVSMTLQKQKSEDVRMVGWRWAC